MHIVVYQQLFSIPFVDFFKVRFNPELLSSTTQQTCELLPLAHLWNVFRECKLILIWVQEKQNYKCKSVAPVPTMHF